MSPNVLSFKSLRYSDKAVIKSLCHSLKAISFFHLMVSKMLLVVDFQLLGVFERMHHSDQWWYHFSCLPDEYIVKSA
jgi:hypothetical protein